MKKYYTTNIIWKSSLLVLVYIKSNQNIYNFKIYILFKIKVLLRIFTQPL